MTSISRILITPGEPAGIGPDLLVLLAQQSFAAELTVVADPNLLQERAKKLNLPLTLYPFDRQHPKEHTPGSLHIVPVELRAPCFPGQLNPQNAAYVIASLELAAEYCLEKIADALVTGPVHKFILNNAGFSFIGHTEFLAQFCQVPDVMMLFVVDHIKAAIATTHVPLSAVPKKITQDHLMKTLRLFDQELTRLFKLKSPRILVAGLNPHAGEEGLLGREEIDIIKPVLEIMRSENKDVKGPFPADTLFTPSVLAEGDAILGMYHDQILPVIKQIGFNRAVNVTLGLPIIRTSVDHGTALNLAGTSQMDTGSFKAAICLAMKLSSMLS